MPDGDEGEPRDEASDARPGEAAGAGARRDEEHMRLVHLSHAPNLTPGLDVQRAKDRPASEPASP